jgi:hypothetical protein
MNADRLRVQLGVLLLVLAALCWGARGPLGGTDRAWSPNAVPPSSALVSIGTTYHLSTVLGPAGRVQSGAAALSCVWRAEGGVEPAAPLTVQAVADERVTHVIASFAAPASGRLSITCPNAGPVFVDDADGIARDPGSLLLLGAVGLGIVGLCLAASGRVRRHQPVIMTSISTP